MAGLTAIILLAGCSCTQPQIAVDEPEDDRMTEVVRLLEKGNETAADRLLEDICSTPRVEGITDEALFRLSILQLRKYDDAKMMQGIQKKLATLQSEYPESQWSRMSWPLTEYMARQESLKSELRAIKQKNITLTRDNKELNLSNQQLQGTVQNLTKENREIIQRIEKLKSLDLELEKKNRL